MQWRAQDFKDGAQIQNCPYWLMYGAELLWNCPCANKGFYMERGGGVNLGHWSWPLSWGSEFSHKFKSIPNSSICRIALINNKLQNEPNWLGIVIWLYIGWPDVYVKREGYCCEVHCRQLPCGKGEVWGPTPNLVQYEAYLHYNFISSSKQKMG